MPDDITIRARVSGDLKRRLANYIAGQNARGLSLDESSVVRSAVVEYLEAKELSALQANDRPNSAKVERAVGNAVKTTYPKHRRKSKMP